MPQYMLILHEVPGATADVSPAEMQAIIARYVEWATKLGEAGKHKGGHKLVEEGGRVLRREGDRVVVADGPYAEALEVVGGYFLIEAAARTPSWWRLGGPAPVLPRRWWPQPRSARRRRGR